MLAKISRRASGSSTTTAVPGSRNSRRACMATRARNPFCVMRKAGARGALRRGASSRVLMVMVMSGPVTLVGRRVVRRLGVGGQREERVVERPLLDAQFGGDDLAVRQQRGDLLDQVLTAFDLDLRAVARDRGDRRQRAQILVG